MLGSGLDTSHCERWFGDSDQEKNEKNKKKGAGAERKRRENETHGRKVCVAVEKKPIKNLLVVCLPLAYESERQSLGGDRNRR